MKGFFFLVIPFCLFAQYTDSSTMKELKRIDSLKIAHYGRNANGGYGDSAFYSKSRHRRDSLLSLRDSIVQSNKTKEALRSAIETHDVTVHDYTRFRDSLIGLANSQPLLLLSYTKIISRIVNMKPNSLFVQDSVSGTAFIRTEIGPLFLQDSAGKAMIKSDVIRFRDSVKVLAKAVFGDSNKIVAQVMKGASAYLDSIKKVNDEYEKKVIACGAVKIYGSVKDIDENSIDIFGFAASAKCSDEDFANMRCNDEGVKGALHEQSNIRILNYSSNRKTEGSLVIGNTIGITGYRYSSRTTGTNGFGAAVPVYVYSPCNSMPSQEKRDNKISYFNEKIGALYSRIGMTETQFQGFVDESNSIDKDKIRNFLKL